MILDFGSHYKVKHKYLRTIFLLYKKWTTRFYWVKPKAIDHEQANVQVLQTVYTIKNNSS